jgi:sodium/bile acid cotransporter 7
MAVYRPVLIRKRVVINGLRRQWFVCGLLVAVWLAFYFPEAVAPASFLSADWLVPFGIWIIFLVQGMALRHGEREDDRQGSGRGILAFVLLWNYLFFPLLVVGLLSVTGLWGRSDFTFGYWLLAFLPTTIASAVALTSVSGGRIAPALLATVVSNFLAVWVLPAAALLFLALKAEVQLEFLPLVLRLALLIILPLLLGIFLRQVKAPGTLALAGIARPLTQVFLLLIIYAAFSRSVSAGTLAGLSAGSLLEVLLVCGVLLLLVSVLAWRSTGWCGFSYSERVGAFYCASQKSLATGLPLISSVLLATGYDSAAVAALLPVLCYHPLQLLLGGFLVAGFMKPKDP